MRRLKQLLDSGKPVLSAWCGITDPRFLERVCEFSFDAVVLDMQHGFFDETSVQTGIATLIAKGKAPFVRIPLDRWDSASRVLDFGALGVIAPMINTAEDARTACGLALPELSMGMSGDFEAAIAEGSTLVRIGGAIFGPRQG